MEDTAGGGLGIVANRDTREHQRYPNGGSYTGFSGTTVPEWLGSEEGYYVLEGETNHYLKVRTGQVLALRAYGRFTPSDTPYSGLSTLGKRSDLRGYTSGEKVAENLISTQAEYRWMFTRRWGVVGFAGVATLYDGNLGNIETDNIYFSGGAGIRFRLHQENRVNFRVDYAVGENDQDGFYVGVMEAF
jgi:hemolysin activation/secretion protein